MSTESGLVLNSRGNPMSRSRIAWGISLLVIAAAIGTGAGMLWSWTEAALAVGQTFFFVFSAGPLMFFGLILSALAAATGMILLVPRLISRIPNSTIRRISKLLVSACVIVTALAWLYFWLATGLLSIAATYYQVTAETGESVVVGKPGFDPASYAVYTQKSTFVFEREPSVEGTAASGHFVPDACTLRAQDAILLLTCGDEMVSFPNPLR